ncbi:Uncharacterised protein [BD1-7 clade bacterium]|uniref:DUF547 domain-containing protein n=1 Tax=BD1-7 clade bacterium TaxID=2029982 RepID=A0A5S9QJX3_9GAMM|nr:Uncharacterised protein [BD1-7 clade bacterium]
MPANTALKAQLIRITSLFILLGMNSAFVTSSPFDHGDWQILAHRHVVMINNNHASEVDYAGMQKDEQLLNQYLLSLSAVTRPTFDRWSKDEQLAFLINAYNAVTVKRILEKYPDIKSIKELGSWFQNPWKKPVIELLGEKRSLDDIEHGLIRGSGRYNDPRIHFAVNCASIGCPALQNSAFIGEKIDQQLDSATNNFLGDKSRNRYADSKMQVSKIFDWYRGDFEKGFLGADSLGAFLALYKNNLSLTEEQSSQLASGKMTISFLPYDWQLNGLNQ